MGWSSNEAALPSSPLTLKCCERERARMGAGAGGTTPSVKADDSCHSRWVQGASVDGRSLPARPSLAGSPPPPPCVLCPPRDAELLRTVRRTSPSLSCPSASPQCPGQLHHRWETVLQSQMRLAGSTCRPLFTFHARSASESFPFSFPLLLSLSLFIQKLTSRPPTAHSTRPPVSPPPSSHRNHSIHRRTDAHGRRQ